ncbi:MAG: helix-turn-helix transcriptional regulator [Nanoarchaeota archaeon]|nr:helix-turn-helix transcriptional regulator [Nanoarchaeota archaeon]
MRKNKHEAKIELSKDVINYLHDVVGDTYRQIGQKIDVSESYISRVHNGERNLTLEHLVKIESAYKIALPIILLKFVKTENVPEELRPLYGTAKELLVSAEHLKDIIQSQL